MNFLPSYAAFAAAAASAASCFSIYRFEMLGLLTFLDPPRPDTKDTIHKAIAYGVGVKMITGDHRLIAQETARQLDMGDDVRTVEGTGESEREL